jgi:hypothetical protein
MAKMIKKLNLSRKSIILVFLTTAESQFFQACTKKHLHIVLMLNLKFQPDKFKNNEEMQLYFFAVLATRVPFCSKVYHIFILRY